MVMGKMTQENDFLNKKVRLEGDVIVLELIFKPRGHELSYRIIGPIFLFLEYRFGFC